MKILYRFHLFVLLPALLCLVVLSLLLARLSSNALVAEQDNRLRLITLQTRSLMELSLTRVENDLTTLLASGHLGQYFMYDAVGETDFVEDIRATMEENFLALNRAKPEYASLRIFRTDGHGIVNITGQHRAYRYPDPGQAEWFTAALKLAAGKFHISTISPCLEHQAPSITVSQLFYYKNSSRAVVSIQLHCQPFFAQLLKETGLGQGTEVCLVDRRGTIVAHDDETKVGQSVTDAALFRVASAEEVRVRIHENDPDGQPSQTASLGLQMTDGVLLISRPLSEVTAVTKALRLNLITASLIVALCLIILITLTVRSVIRPLQQLERLTGQIARGDLNSRLTIQDSGEIGSLASSFNRMTEALQQAQESLRNELDERERGRQEREKLIAELQKALAEVKTLSGFLPICAACKKIRDDKGYWNQIESYIRDHTDAEFSHGICPDCVKKLYPEFAEGQNSEFRSQESGDDNQKKTS
ncbi:MAG: hypothetical protein A2521_16975 [Deltaproteobacteria bacterium RIFOXYD12_FULL_57_12]|nr:MAG: hypothetical protein A2521_16975 [Deltaproteobacteria bacterium RIFOXYD12_FULL_57_12]